MPYDSSPPEAAHDVTIAAEGGARLVGRLLRPRGTARAACVILPATGTPAGFYAAFATWLAAERDMIVLTYDPRGFGRSTSGPRDARWKRIDMRDWGVRDQQAARDWLSNACPGLPLRVIGHSLGGMMLPFQTGLDRIDRVVTVAAGAVHLSDHPWPYRAVAASFWFGHGAAAAATRGYVPGRAMGLGGDIAVPGGVFRQWRRWCTTHGFHAGDPGLPVPDAGDLTARMRFVAVADDALCPPASVWRLMRFYPRAAKEQVTLRPDGTPIGHHGVFRRANARLWPALVD